MFQKCGHSGLFFRRLFLYLGLSQGESLRILSQRKTYCHREMTKTAVNTNTNKRKLPELSKQSVAQWCPTFFDPMDCSSPGSSVHEILQARILKWVAMLSSRGSFWHPCLLRLLNWQVGSLLNSIDQCVCVYGSTKLFWLLFLYSKLCVCFFFFFTL